MCNRWPPTLEGQVTRSAWITRPHITFLQLWARVRARVIDDGELWKLQDGMSPQGLTISISQIFCLHRWPKVRSISLRPHYKSMEEKQVAHFSQILIVITNSNIDGIIHGHPGLLRCKFWYVTAVRSCDVIKGHQNVFFFLLIAADRKELQQRAWSHCVQFIKTHRMI